MPAKKKKPSMRENQKRKATMQQIAKGGPQKSGVKKPEPSAGRRTNPKAAKPSTAKPAGSTQMRALPAAGQTSGRPTTPRRASAQIKQQQAAQGTRGNTLRVRGPAAQTPKPSATSAAVQGVRNAVGKAADRVGAQAGPTLRNAARAGGKAGLAKTLAGKAAVPAALAAQLADVKSGFDKLANHPFLNKNKGQQKTTTSPTNLRGGKSTASQNRQLKEQAASKGSTSKFKGARDAAMKKASAIKGSPVVGPRKSSSGSGSASAAKQFDSAFAAARKAGKSTFTWKGKKYNTKTK
jgi:hypothetical protein